MNRLHTRNSYSGTNGTLGYGNYSTMLDHMVEKIYNVIEKNEKIRYNELKRIVVDKKKIMSERPFREKLAQMVKEGLISRTEIDKQNVVYSAKLDWFEHQKTGEKLFDLMLDDFKKKLENLSSKMDKLSNIEKSNLVVRFIKMVTLLEWNFNRFAENNNITKIKKQRQQLDDLKRKIHNIAFSDDKEEKNKISHIVDHLLSSEYFYIDANLGNIFQRKN